MWRLSSIFHHTHHLHAQQITTLLCLFLLFPQHAGQKVVLAGYMPTPVHIRRQERCRTDPSTPFFHFPNSCQFTRGLNIKSNQPRTAVEWIGCIVVLQSITINAVRLCTSTLPTQQSSLPPMARPELRIIPYTPLYPSPYIVEAPKLAVVYRMAEHRLIGRAAPPHPIRACASSTATGSSPQSPAR